ncbi:MAG: secY [Alphaproteobacteria bacterium]|nr:secY [Alphaproteobacteria bacterium]
MASATEQLASQFNWGSFSKAKDLKSRLWFTLFALIVYRLGTHIPLPGIDAAALAKLFAQKQTGILGMFDFFAGGAIQRMAIFALSITPYITASITLQMITFSSPALTQLKKEGERGYRKINQYTRYLTVIISIIQGYFVAVGLERLGGGGAVINPGIFFRATTTITLVGGTVFLMWLGEQITARGIGNGTSLIIYAAIVVRLPTAIAQLLSLGQQGAISTFFIILIMIAAVALVGFIVFMERAQRRILVQYPKRQVGQKIYGGDSTHLPLKVNSTGVIAAICASALILFPITIMNFLGTNNSGGPSADFARYFQHGQPLYLITYGALIITFSFVLLFMVVNPVDTAENLRKAGGFLPGMKPGKNTADYIKYVLNRITVLGAVYVTFICLLPDFLISRSSIPFYFGGTGLLIAVTVPMDTISQIHSHMVAHQYEGLMRKRRVKGARRK